MGLFGFGKSKRADSLEGEPGTHAPRMEPDASGTPEVSRAERLRFEEMLLRQDLATAQRVALGYAFRRTRSHVMAKQLHDDAFALVWERCSWDPEKGPRVAGLAVRHHPQPAESREGERKYARDVEQKSLAEPSTSPDVVASPEALAWRSTRSARTTRGRPADQEWLRRAFEDAGDEVNLLWLKHALRASLTTIRLRWRGASGTSTTSTARRSGGSVI